MAFTTSGPEGAFRLLAHDGVHFLPGGGDDARRADGGDGRHVNLVARRGDKRSGGHGLGVHVGIGGNGQRLDAFHHHLTGFPGQAAGRVQVKHHGPRLFLLRPLQDAVHEAEALLAGQGVFSHGDDHYPVAEGFLRGRPERGPGKQGQQSQQQKVNMLHACKLTRSVPALNGEMRFTRAVAPDAAAPPQPAWGRSMAARPFFPVCASPGYPDSVSLCMRRGCARLAAPYGKD